METAQTMGKSKQRKILSVWPGGGFENQLAFPKLPARMVPKSPQRRAATLFLNFSREVNSLENLFQLICCCIQVSLSQLFLVITQQLSSKEPLNRPDNASLRWVNTKYHYPHLTDERIEEKGLGHLFQCLKMGFISSISQRKCLQGFLAAPPPRDIQGQE